MQNHDAALRTETSYTGWFTQSRYPSRTRRPATLMLVPMIDIFTVLVTFLLMTAVFSRITILQLDLPSDTQSTGFTPPAFRLEVIVRRDGFELTNGSSLIATIPKVDGEYDLKTLSGLALALKREYPTADDASVLMERDIAYDHLIQVMDAIRSTEEPPPADAVVAGQAMGAPQAATVAAGQGMRGLQADAAGTGAPRTPRVPLFAHIAVGEAP